MLTVYSKTVCPYCVNAKNFLKARGIDFQEVNIEEDAAARDFILGQGHKSVPQIYFNGELFVEGGWTGLSKLSTEELNERLGR
jgi:glutaredoxin 3